EGNTLKLRVTSKDETAEYWRVLEESLNRHAALVFTRAGGRVRPAVFHVSANDADTIAAEADASRRALHEEIAKLREEFGHTGYLLQQPDEICTAYRALSNEPENLLELHHAWAALRVLIRNAQLLSSCGRCQCTRGSDGARSWHMRRHSPAV